jgi:hypothetical protein
MFKDFYIYSAQPAAVAGGAAAPTALTNISGQADFEIVSQVATAIDRRVRVQIQDSGSGRTWHDKPSVSLAAWFGDGRQPFHLPVSKILKRGSVISTDITDESGANNRVRLAWIGAKLFPRPPFPRPEYVAREAFTLTVPFVAAAVDRDGLGTIAANGVGVQPIRIPDGADFEIRKLAIGYDLAIPAGLDTVATILLKDEGGQYQFMDRPIPVESLGGSRFVDPHPAGFFPFVMRTPRLMEGGSVLSVTVNNLDAANALTMRVSFHGAKLYRSAPIR